MTLDHHTLSGCHLIDDDTDNACNYDISPQHDQRGHMTHQLAHRAGAKHVREGCGEGRRGLNGWEADLANVVFQGEAEDGPDAVEGHTPAQAALVRWIWLACTQLLCLPCHAADIGMQGTACLCPVRLISSRVRPKMALMLSKVMQLHRQV